MPRHTMLGDVLMFSGGLPRRRPFLLALRYYPLIIAVFVALIIEASVYPSQSTQVVTVICLSLYAIYKLVQHFALKSHKVQTFYEQHGREIQMLRAFFLIIAVYFYLNYLHSYTDHFTESTGSNTLWLLYLLPIFIMSQYGVSVWMFLTIGLSAFLITIQQLNSISNWGLVLYLDILVKVLWLSLLAFIVHILTRFINDGSAKLRLLHDVQDQIMETYSIADEQLFLNTVARSIAQKFRYPDVNIFELQSNGNAKCVAGSSSGGTNLALERSTLGPVKPSIVLHVLQTGQTHLANDVNVCKHYREHAEFPNTRAELVVPVKIGEQTIMAIDIQEHQKDVFIPQQDTELIENLSNYVGRLLDNLRLVKSVQRAVESIGRHFLSREELSRTLGEIAESAAKALKADIVVIYQYNPFDKRINVAARYGDLRAPEYRTEVVTDPRHLVHKILTASRNSYFEENLKSSPDEELTDFQKRAKIHEYPSFVEREGIESRSTIRLKAIGTNVGVMFVNFRSHRKFDEQAKRKIFLYAGLAALTIHRGQTQNLYSTSDMHMDQQWQAYQSVQLSAVTSIKVRQIMSVATSTRTRTGEIDQKALEKLFTELPSLKLSNMSDDEALRHFAAEPLEIDSSELTIVYRTGAGASGAPVRFVEDTAGNQIAAIKVFPKAEEFARELSALEKLETAQLQVAKTYTYFNLSKVQVADREVGVVMMSIVQGTSLDSYLKIMGQRVGLGKGEGFTSMKEAVARTAVALAELHTKPIGSASEVPEFYIEKRIQEIQQILAKLERNQISRANLKIAPQQIKKHVSDLIQDFRKHPGTSSIVHGDAHPGNFFFHEVHGITIIDIPTMHYSMNDKGTPIGTPARDITNFYLKLAHFGRHYGVDRSEIQELQKLFLENYKSAGGAMLTKETMRFFEARTLLGEVLTAIEIGIPQATNTEKKSYIIRIANDLVQHVLRKRHVGEDYLW